MKSTGSSFIASILIVSLLLTGYGPPVVAQDRPIVITFGQPNIWSLEQAHYLLARMHRQNLDLQTATLGTLDPNAPNASRIDILKTLLQAGVSFDQAVGLNNELLRRDKVFNTDRRRQLLNNRSTLQAESTQLAREIAALRVSRASAANEQEQAQIQETIDAKTEEKAAVDNQLTQTNDELKDSTSTTGEFQSATVPEFSTSTISGDLDSLIDQVELIDPSIAATLRLDNHIQLQYEIIAKQLTLLRDEVGPGERLVFLELPQSINATQDRAENKMAQAWWRIAGYTTIDRNLVFLKELRRLLEQIEAIQTEFTATEDLTLKNSAHKDALNEKLRQLCNDRDALERAIASLNDQIAATERRKAELESAFDAAKNSVASAETELADAIKSRNGRRIRRAQERLYQAQRNLDNLRDQVTSFNQTQLLRCQEMTAERDDLKTKLAELEIAIAETRESIQKIDAQQNKLDKDHARLIKAYTSLSTKYERLRLERMKKEIREQQDRADRLLQGGGANTTEVVEQVMNFLDAQSKAEKGTYSDTAPPLKLAEMKSRGCTDLYKREGIDPRCEPRRFFDLEERNENDLTRLTDNRTTTVRRRAVRTIDIIPRQNAINVLDTKQRVARTGIFAAFSFLFGFAGKFTYERQREQAEQFLNQELFTSGFGKGEKDFGWSFFPFAGTRQLASGVRTTYAVAIVPDNAETLVLKARGCYFPRKDNQPLDYNTAATRRWTDRNARTALCTPTEQIFVVPVPGGSGDGADYYVTEIRYSAFQEPGSRMVASIRGQNIPSQIGVLVEGVPLREAVGLGQLNIESILSEDKTRDNCVGQICGRFERIDANEIVISFKTPPDFAGTPRIGLIGPGRSIELNKLLLTINGDEDVQLNDAEAMFGDPPDPNLRRIADFRVAPPQPGSTQMTGVLTGSKFKDNDNIFVNGSAATPSSTCRKDLCIVSFSPQTTDYLTVTISPADPAEKAVSKTFVNPTNLNVISASVVSYEPEVSSNPDVLTVKLDGSGFRQALEVTITKPTGPPDIPLKIVPSAGQMFLKIIRPEAVVHINVKDPANNREISAVVVRPQVRQKEKK